MKGGLIVEATITIDAPVSKVWQALTSPELIAKYLYGAKVTTDWKVGSSITYEGEYNGKTYKDKGVIETFEPNHVYASTYWSSMSGKEDKPENYNLVTYTLLEAGDKTTVNLTQNNVADAVEQEHLTANWYATLADLKDVAESL
ncbi:SRPBCC domain-containing protein [Flavobacterium zepuense]|uniref:SRPBCC domain-containing protein n=1 Tax=Flavobacterium zepuense TaxID=2593302 RepID=A0A552V0D2_9FLAO|nr:SRPBCC family protein [Flavobacterium zepuense]TRW23918.1 SRPBCC domain-containing protein [Flavobacterium zepuense]